MTKENDYSGALEALDKIENFVHDKHQSDKDNDDVLYGCSFGKIRAALTAAKWRPIDSAPIDLGFKYLVTNKWGDIGTGTNEYVSDFYDIGNGEYVRTATIKDPTHWKHLDYPTQDGGDDVNKEFCYVTSAELFQELGMTKEEAERGERGLNAVIRREQIKVDNSGGEQK